MDFDASDVTVSILTGMRPELLEQTIISTREVCPGFLETAFVQVHWNTGDEATGRVLADHWDVLDEVDVTESLWNISASTNSLADRALASERTYWMMLQDDFGALPGGGPWLDEARAFLDAGVAKVLLRRASDRVSNTHYYTGEKMPSRSLGAHRLYDFYHFTYNPALLRTEDLVHAFPTTGEGGSITKWHESRFPRDTIQMRPGVWTHLGNVRKGLSLKFKNRRINPNKERPDLSQPGQDVRRLTDPPSA